MKPNNNPRAIIAAIGDELLFNKVDSNGQVFAKQLTYAGVSVVARVMLPDQLELLTARLRQLWRECDILLIGGGLGPTQDDLTRQAVAEALHRPLVENQAAVAGLKKFFQQRGMHMPPSNRIQACLPQGAAILANPRGTAPGFWINEGNRAMAVMPGPPWECLPMFAEQVWPRLQRQFRFRPASVWRQKYLRITGVAESKLQDLLGPVFPAATGLNLSFLIDEPGEILVGLSTQPGRAAHAGQALQQGIRTIKKILGTNVVGPQASALPQVVGMLLKKHRQTMAVAESCTGGRICQRITAIPGSSAYFLEGAVVYQNQAKSRRLGVSAQLLEKYGAVSAQVAAAMARGIRRTAKADWGVAVTGIAGPGGGSKHKPVGTVFYAVAGPDDTVTVERILALGDREFIQRRSATMALDALRRALLAQRNRKPRP